MRASHIYCEPAPPAIGTECEPAAAAVCKPRVGYLQAATSRAQLVGTLLLETNFEGANLTCCQVYGISAWNVNLTGAQQSDLVITQPDEPVITVDNLEAAQFIYLSHGNDSPLCAAGHHGDSVQGQRICSPPLQMPRRWLSSAFPLAVLRVQLHLIRCASPPGALPARFTRRRCCALRRAPTRLW
jgi:Pentapeptide repeats (8 copies)